jgi:hypothetical protein
MPGVFPDYPAYDNMRPTRRVACPARAMRRPVIDDETIALRITMIGGDDCQGDLARISVSDPQQFFCSSSATGVLINGLPPLRLLSDHRGC